MKKATGLLLGLVLTAGLIFTSCAKKEQDANTVTLWHWMTDRHASFQELAKRYHDLTGVTVKVDLFAPSDSYTQKITASTQAKILPDIFGILDTKQTLADYIKYGYVAEMTAQYMSDNAAWEKSMFKKALDGTRFEEGNSYGVKPGIYGVPIDVMNIQMLYNIKLLQKAGYSKPPKTFEEFVEMSKALNRVGVAGMVSGWGELWMMDCFASNYAFNIMGEDKVMATYRGEVPYTDPDWLKVFSIFKQLTDTGSFATGIITKPNKEAELDFALERAAFAFNGSWSVNVYHEMNPDLQYGAMLPPAYNSARPMKIWGGGGSSFVVNATSPHKDQAIAFLKWLSEKEQQAYLSTETKNLPANKEALASIPKVLEQFASAMDNTTHPTIWELNEDPSVSERFAKGLQSIIIGNKTPEEVAEEVQAVKVKQMEKKARKK